MSRLYPRSFLQLLLAAFLLTGLPLGFALVQAVLSVERLAAQSRQAVGQSAQAARASRQLVDETVALERAARQFLVLGDAQLLVDYETLRTRFQATGEALAGLPLDPAQRLELARAVETEPKLYQRLRSDHGERARLAEEYAGLSALARGVLRASDASTERAVQELGEAAAAAERGLWWQLAAMVLLGLAAVAAASRLITRPVDQLDSAIRRLGAGELEANVRVDGPEDLSQLGERLEWLRLRLAELEGQKSRFLRHVSHELKTPLTALREGAELLADGVAGPLSSGQQEIVDILRHKSVQLARLIERLLDYQRTLDGLGRVVRVPVALDVLVRQVVEEQKLAVAARELTLRLELAPVTVAGDREKLATVFDNLLSNAIKHSPVGTTITVTVAGGAEGVCLTVDDQGTGVPPTEVERIFDWFFQGKERPQGAVPGSGLGLSIARELVEAHQGRLTALPGPGGHFRLLLPAAPAPYPAVP